MQAADAKHAKYKSLLEKVKAKIDTETNYIANSMCGLCIGGGKLGC